MQPMALIWFRSWHLVGLNLFLFSLVSALNPLPSKRFHQIGKHRQVYDDTELITQIVLSICQPLNRISCQCCSLWHFLFHYECIKIRYALLSSSGGFTPATIYHKYIKYLDLASTGARHLYSCMICFSVICVSLERQLNSTIIQCISGLWT